MTIVEHPPQAPLSLAWVRDVLLLGLGVAAGAAAITIMSRIMRSITAVGGSCADGGPYVSAQSCPDGTEPAILTAVGLVLFCVGATLWGAARLDAPEPLFWGWPALFFTLGWNFLDYGWIDPPAGAGVSGGFVFCGVLFFVLGGTPLLFGALALRESARTNRAQAEQQRRQALTAVATTVSRHASALAEPAARPPGAGRPFIPPTQPDLPGGDVPDRAEPSVTERLERLAAVHAAGSLTDDEFFRAESATLREEIDR